MVPWRTAIGITAVGLALAGGSAAPAEARGNLLLVDKGAPTATIVLAEEPTRSAQFAAAELQYHVRKITGAPLPIRGDDAPVQGNRILVGDSRAAERLGLSGGDLKPQEYLIRFAPGAVVLLGRDKDDRAKVEYGKPETFPDLYDEQGTCYAVYDFLERCCGVRWYLPSEFGIDYRETATLRVTGRDVRRAPAVKWRSQSIGYQFPADLCGDTIKGPQPTPVLPWREQMLWWHRQRLGGEAYALNHSFYGYYDRFLKEHPDWFAQGYEGKPPQMCFTNAGFIAQVVQDARDFFDGKGAKPGAQAAGDYFALVPMDNNAWCKCPACRALLKKAAERGKGHFSNDLAGDYIFAFANQVAREIRKSHPGKWIAAGAYAEYAYPPARERLEPNVSVQMCLHARNVYSPSLQANDRAIVDAWAADSRERPKYVWLYYCFPSLVATQQQFRCFPGFFAHSVLREMERYRKAGVRGIYYEPSYLAYERRSPLLDQLEAYLTWKFADDPRQNGGKLIDEFFTRYYGAAAGPMKAFYERVERIFSDPASYPAGFSGHQTEQIAWGSLGTEARMAELGALMEQARKACQTDREQQRVALFDKGVWQFMLAGRKTFAERERLKAPTMQRTRVPRIRGSAPVGDPAKVDWSAAAVLGHWRTLTGDVSPRKVEARLLHDGTTLYLRLEECLDPKKLVVTGDVWSEDEWEIFIARQRALPYHQMGVNSTGTHIDFAWPGMAKWESRAVVVSETGAPDRWQVKMALPLAQLVPGGAKPGDTLYLNIIRSTQNRDALAWVPTFGGYHEPARLGEVAMEE